MNKATKTYNSPFPKVQAFQKKSCRHVASICSQLGGLNWPWSRHVTVRLSGDAAETSSQFPPVWISLPYHPSKLQPNVWRSDGNNSEALMALIHSPHDSCARNARVDLSSCHFTSRFCLTFPVLRQPSPILYSGPGELIWSVVSTRMPFYKGGHGLAFPNGTANSSVTPRSP